MRRTAVSEAYSEPSPTSKMELFARIANCFQPLTSKKARLSETVRFIELWYEGESLWNILSDNYNIGQEKEKSVGRMSGKLELTSN